MRGKKAPRHDPHRDPRATKGRLYGAGKNLGRCKKAPRAGVNKRKGPSKATLELRRLRAAFNIDGLAPCPWSKAQANRITRAFCREHGLRVTTGFVEHLRGFMAWYIGRLFEAANRARVHAKRATLFPEDVETALEMCNVHTGFMNVART